jgi:hypothetical protein
MNKIIANTSVILSFFVYCFAALSLYQENFIPFVIEEQGPIPIVLSHELFGSRLGLIDFGLNHYFWGDADRIPARGAVAGAVGGAVLETHDVGVSTMGIGVGPIIAVDLAFTLFGPEARALPLFFLLLVGISASCFVIRYQDDRILAVPMVFFSFTLLLCTGVVSPAWAAQAPLGGFRSYAILGILPAVHWCFAFLDRRGTDWAESIIQWALLGIQVVLLGFAILVRGAPAYLLLPVFIFASVSWLRARDGRTRIRTLLRMAIPLAGLMVCLGSLPRLAFPDYAQTGRLYGLVWHRAFVSFGLNPDWPFAGLREKYDCSGWLPMGIKLGDQDGQCVWFAYGPNRVRPADEVAAEIYDGAYEKVLRDAFFDVLWSNPREAFYTLFVIKPEITWNVTLATLRPLWSDETRLVLPWVILQVILYLAFVITRPSARPLQAAGAQASVLLIFLLSALGPQLVAGSNPATEWDIFIYILCGGAIGISFLASSAVYLRAQAWRLVGR